MTTSVLAEREATTPTGAIPRGAGRVVIASFLFNWPSTAGGIIHTIELGTFLRAAGYDVVHLFARYEPWSIGRLDEALGTPTEIIEFTRASWSADAIQDRFREAARRLNPDAVIVTDSWNFKPLLAEAIQEFPYILRQQALECLCPLNNLRLLGTNSESKNDGPRQCPYTQLANRDECLKCLQSRKAQSGLLHQLERELSGVELPDYEARLKRIIRDAQAVLVLNSRIEALIAPFARRVNVVTWGMDPARFPWPPEESQTDAAKQIHNADGRDVKTLFMAGVVEESTKGFHVLHAACDRLWKQRRDFRLVATGAPAGDVDAFTRFTGWLSQDELPRQMRAADIVVMPTIAQEGLGRSTVEAMGVGRPVVAARIGGLSSTVDDGVTGLLFRPGDAADLSRKLTTLLDDGELRERLAAAGRRSFEQRFLWPDVIERHYRPLLEACIASPQTARDGS